MWFKLCHLCMPTNIFSCCNCCWYSPLSQTLIYIFRMDHKMNDLFDHKCSQLQILINAHIIYSPIFNLTFVKCFKPLFSVCKNKYVGYQRSTIWWEQKSWTQHKFTFLQLQFRSQSTWWIVFGQETLSVSLLLDMYGSTFYGSRKNVISREKIIHILIVQDML